MGSYQEKEAIPLKRVESTISSSGLWERKNLTTWNMTVTRKKIRERMQLKSSQGFWTRKDMFSLSLVAGNFIVKTLPHTMLPMKLRDGLFLFLLLLIFEFLKNTFFSILQQKQAIMIFNWFYLGNLIPIKFANFKFTIWVFKV